MYPFERFTERAKKVLALAQTEAELAHRSYIGTEHLLLGLLREANGLAAHVLVALGVEIERVRTSVDAVLSTAGPAPAAQGESGVVIPTSRVKKVIEISFDEARRMGHRYVGTEHILLGLMVEGEGIAPHVLNDLGVTLDAVRAEIDRRLAAAQVQTPPPPPLSRQLQDVLNRAGELAAGSGATEVGLDHVERAIASWRAEQQ